MRRLLRDMAEVFRRRRARWRTRSLPKAPVVELGPDEAQDLVAKVALQRFNMSPEEFRRAWEAGKFDYEHDRVAAEEVAALLPFGR